MAIIINNPTTITDDVMKMYNLMVSDGKQFLKDYAGIVERLSQNWTGSDAVSNQKDLANVYAEVTKLIKTLENLVIKVNNEEFGWIEEKKQFSSFIEAGEYLQKYYDK